MPIEPVADKWRAFGWHVQRLTGTTWTQIVGAFETALAVKGQPVAIVAKTIKGRGVSFMENIPEWHGKAPNAEQYQRALAELAGGAQ